MESILQIDNLTVSFDGFKAVNNVNTGIDKGEIRFFIDSFRDRRTFRTWRKPYD